MLASTLCPILVGRESELATLRDLLPRGGVVLLSGEAGIGKSRLLKDFAQESADQDYAVVWGRPEALSDPGPYSLLLDLLDNIAATGAPPASEAKELAETLAGPKHSGSELPARQIAARTRGFLGGLGVRRVLLLEDLHLADEPSQAVIAHLARSAKDDGTLVVGALRTDEELSSGTAKLLDLLSRDRLVLNLQLKPLGEAELRTMVAAMWGEEPSQADLASIAERGDGVPFLVEELAAARGAGDAIPESVALAVAARLQRLDADARAILTAASLSPGALDPEVLALATGVSEVRLPECLMEGVRVGLLEDQAGRIAYRHRLLREAVSASILSVERKALHERIAVAIEESRSDETPRFSAVLAHHQESAGNLTAAAHWLSVAGGRALQAGSLAEAEQAYSRALALCGNNRATRARVLRGLADVHLRTSRPTKAVDLLAESSDLFVSGNDPAAAGEAKSFEAFVRASLGQAEALPLSEEGLRLSSSDESARAQALYRRGFVVASVYRQREAIEVLREALAAAEFCEDAELVVQSALELSRLHTLSGEATIAGELGELARRLAIDKGLDYLIAKASAAEGSRLSFLGENRLAVERLDDASRALTDGLGSHLLADVNTVRAIVYWRMGLPAEADRVARRLEFGSRASVGYGRVIRVWSAVERGDEEWARQLLDRWWESVGVGMRDLSSKELRELPESPEGGQFAQLGDAVLAAFVREPSAVEEDRARRYWELCADAFLETRVQAGLLLALTLAHRNALDGTEKVLDHLGDDFSASHKGLVLEARAEIARGRGDLDSCANDLREARAAWAAIENSSDQARVLLKLAELSEGADAKALLKEALRLADAAGASKYVHLAEAMSRARGIRPRAGRPKGSARKEGLSSREEEVVTLVATGATNAEIATRLFLSERTVQDHISKAGRRLGVTGRAGLAAWAAKQGLI